MGTSQSVIARLESARHMPTFDMVARYAAAIDRRIDIHLVPAGSGREVLALASGQSGDGDAACFNPPAPAVSLRPAGVLHCRAPTRCRCRWGHAMELSIREAKARFAEAAAAAGAGGACCRDQTWPSLRRAGLGAARVRHGFRESRHRSPRARLHGLTVRLPPDFDDPAFSRQVIGLDK